MKMTVLVTENGKHLHFFLKTTNLVCYWTNALSKEQRKKKIHWKLIQKFINWKKINRFSYYVSQTLSEFVVFVILLTSFFLVPSCRFHSFCLCNWNHWFGIFIEYSMNVHCTRFGRYTRYTRFHFHSTA